MFDESQEGRDDQNEMSLWKNVYLILIEIIVLRRYFKHSSSKSCSLNHFSWNKEEFVDFKDKVIFYKFILNHTIIT